MESKISWIDIDNIRYNLLPCRIFCLFFVSHEKPVRTPSPPNHLMFVQTDDESKQLVQDTTMNNLNLDTISLQWIMTDFWDRFGSEGSRLSQCSYILQSKIALASCASVRMTSFESVSTPLNRLEPSISLNEADRILFIPIPPLLNMSTATTLLISKSKSVSSLSSSLMGLSGVELIQLNGLEQKKA